MQNGTNFMDRNLKITRKNTFPLFFDPQVLLQETIPKIQWQKHKMSDGLFIARGFVRAKG